MKALKPTAVAALESGGVAIVQLVKIEFPSGVIALNSSNWTFTWEGVTYVGAYGLGTVSPITDKPGDVQGLTLTLDGGDPLRIALALDSADEVQGSPVTIRTAIIESANYTILEAPIDWTGSCDTMAISEDGEKAEVSVSVESRAVDLTRGNPSTYSDGSQRARYPADRAFEYAVSQVDKPVTWPAKEALYR